MRELDLDIRYGFLPGCSLSSYNPEFVRETVAYLNTMLPHFSAILRCCGKPTRDIGQQSLFEKRFAGMQQEMKASGIDKMILACPNCKKVFDESLGEPSLSLWEILPAIGLPDGLRGKAAGSDVIFAVHDSCSARYDAGTQDGVRWILSELGYQYVESVYSRENTRCCGFGGQIQPIDPELTAKVTDRRLATLPDGPIVTYCATCRSAFMQRGARAWHILDLIWGPVVYADSNPPVDVLVVPENVWYNRFETRKGLVAELG